MHQAAEDLEFETAAARLRDEIKRCKKPNSPLLMTPWRVKAQ